MPSPPPAKVTPLLRSTPVGRLLAITVVVFSIACVEDRPAPTSPDAQLADVRIGALANVERALSGSDAFYAAVDRDVPGFAGFFRDESGEPVVLLTDPSREQQVVQRLHDFLARRGISAGDVQFQEATYRWTQLVGWKVAARTALGTDGIVTLDASESRNRLVVGVRPGSDMGAAEAELEDLGIPLDAVETHQRTAPTPLASLSDRHRPIVGGVKIDKYSTGGECTIGVNVQYDGSDETFLTAGHCTTDLGSVASGSLGRFAQPDWSGTDQVGSEVVDPPFFTRNDEPQCPSNWDCRFSDAALVELDDTVDWSFGHIAQTQSSGQWSGSVYIDPLHPKFWVTSKEQWPATGDSLHKMGRSSGWTVGEVSVTCQDDYQVDYFHICYDVVQAGAEGGDSGAPVFETLGGDSVRFHGILFGGWDTAYAFSSVEMIEDDFGFTLDVTVSPPSPPVAPTISIDGPTEIKHDAVCTWAADISAGTPPFVYDWENEGLQVSTDSTYTGGEPAGSSDDEFTLELTVTNAAGSDSDQITVEEDSGAMICII